MSLLKYDRNKLNVNFKNKNVLNEYLSECTTEMKYQIKNK